MAVAQTQKLSNKALSVLTSATLVVSLNAPVALADEGQDASSEAQAGATQGTTAQQEALTSAIAASEAAADVAATVTVDGATTSYQTLAEAVAAANATSGSTLTIAASVTDGQSATFNAPVNVTAAAGVTFDGTLTFVAGSEGSTVKGVTFDRRDPGAAGGNINSIQIEGVSNITVGGTGAGESNTFNAPSALYQGKEWQYNGVWVRGAASNVVVSGNNFNLGRMNDTNGSGAVAAGSNANSAINLVGGVTGDKANIDGVTISDNVLTVTAPDAAATQNASVNLLIANGNAPAGSAAYGIANVTVSGNTYNGSADANNANTRLAGISNVSGITFAKNAVQDASKGISQSVWSGNTSKNEGVTVEGSNTFENVQVPFDANASNIVATAVAPDGSLTAGTLDEAVAAANATSGAKVTLLQDVTDHASATFKTPVDVTAAAATFNGSMRISGSNSTVSGINFVYDADADGSAKASLLVSSNTENVTVLGNVFTVNDGAKGQPNAVWIEGSAKNTKVHDNTFNLGNGDDISVVGVALTAWSSTVMDGTQITNNKVTMTGAYTSGGYSSSFNLFIKAFGAHETSKGSFGITNLTVSGNTFDSEQPEGVGNFFGLSNVNGLTFEKNTVKNTMYGVFNVNYQGKTEANTGMVVGEGNSFESVKYTIRPKVVDVADASGNVVSQGITYKTGKLVTHETDVSKFRGEKTVAPETPNGMLFAGWYKDAELTEPLAATDTTGAAYASFVEKAQYTSSADAEHNGVINFMGGALRYGNYLNPDGSYDFTQSSIRYGYSFDAPGEATVTKVAWEYGYDAQNLTLSVDSTAQRNPNTDPLGTDPSWAKQNDFIANLVLTKVQSNRFDSSLFVRPSATYTTPDGTQVKVIGSTENRSVTGLAKAISADQTESQDAREYANGLLAAIDQQ